MYVYCITMTPLSYIYSQNTRLRRVFPRPPGEWRLRRLRCETAAFGGGERERKTKKIWGAGGAPAGASAYAAFGGEKNLKKFGRLWRPKWF